MARTNKLRQRIECAVERRETVAVNLLQSLDPEDLTKFLSGMRLSITTMMLEEDNKDRLTAEILYLGLAKVSALAQDRQAFNDLFKE